MQAVELSQLLKGTSTRPGECEWLEFKHSKYDPAGIGKNLSALSNAAALHACLRYVCGETMTNTSLRERFAIERSNYPMASRIVKDTIEAGLLRRLDTHSQSTRDARYVPFWA